MHVVCKWIGNSQPVAAEHYMKLTCEHFERAVGNAAQNAVQKVRETSRNASKCQGDEVVKTTKILGNYGTFGLGSTTDKAQECPPKDSNLQPAG